MNGILGSKNLIAGVTQSIYVCNSANGAVVTFNICNKSNTTMTVKVAITSQLNAVLDTEWLEYKIELLPKAVLERTGVGVLSGQYVTVQTSEDSSAMCWGFEAGDPVTPLKTIVTNTSVPSWTTANSLPISYTAGTSYQLVATDPANDPLTYSVTSGILPEGMILSSSGLISGNSGVSSNVTISVSDGNNFIPRKFNILRNKLADGLTASTAGSSAAQIKADTGVTTNGVYWIDLPTVGPTQIYCIMDSNADGGGWMMAMKATTGTTFNYSASYWTTINTLNPSNNDRSNADAKFNTMNYFAGKDLLAVWPDIATRGGGLGTTAASNPFGTWTWLQNNFSGGTRTTMVNFFNTAGTYNTGTVNTANSYGGYFIGLAKANNAWQSGIFSSQNAINFYGFNYKNYQGSYGVHAYARWGFGWNENSEGDYSSPATLAGGGAQGSDDVSGGIGLDTSFGNYSAGDYIACCQDTTGINRQARVEIYVR